MVRPRTPEEEERYQEALKVSKMLREDTIDVGQADLEFAASVLRDQLSDDTVDDDTKARLQNTIRTLEALAREAGRS